MITPMIKTIAQIKDHNTKYAKNGSSIIRNQNRSQNRRHGLFFIAWTPFIPNFMKPFYHFFAARQTCRKIPGGHSWQRLDYPNAPIAKP